jgi:hypothetical protein
MIICGVRMLARSAVTGTGPPVVRAPPLAARPPVRSLMDAFSSTRSGVKVWGTRIPSSSTKRIADAVRLEMRREGWGSKNSGFRDSERARGR